jgi:hypothetical protein
MSSTEFPGDGPSPSYVPPKNHIERGSLSPPDPGPRNSDYVFRQLAGYLDELEQKTVEAVKQALSQITAIRHRDECDAAFAPLWWDVIQPYASHGMGHRAALFARSHLIPAILSFEAEHSIEFHKGGLFYNTAIVHLAISDHDRFEYFLAMADEEDYRTHGVEGKPRTRGTHNLKMGELSQQTIASGVRFGCDLLNGTFSHTVVTYQFVFQSAITEERFDNWRRTLDGLHHAEWFRILLDAEMFLGRGMPQYFPVLDNPYVLLRLVKVLGHAAQWCESRLTKFQNTLSAGTIKGKSLSPKLKDDPQFVALVTAAGGRDQFPGKNPQGSAVDIELKTLLTVIESQTTETEKLWRLLRVFYIVRNSTAHQIDPSLAFHTDRDYLVRLIQAVMLAYFAIEKLKNSVV